MATTLDSFRGPLAIAAIVLGIGIGQRFIWIPIAAEEILFVSLRLSVVTIVFWVVWNLATLLANTVGWAARRSQTEIDNQMVDFVRRGLRLAILVVYALFVVEVIFDTDVRAVLAGVGIAGLAITLASQDTLKNLIGFFTIYADAPFRMGHLVIYKGNFGEIEDIGFRSTNLRTLDGHVICIPNVELVKEPIENVSARNRIRIKFNIGIIYETPPTKIREAIEIIRGIIGDYAGRNESDSPHVYFDEFEDSSYRLYVQYYYDPPKYWEAQEDSTEVKCKIIDALTAAGIEFAYPTRTLYLNKDDSPEPLGKDTDSAPEDMAEDRNEDIPGGEDDNDDEDGDGGEEA